MYAFEVTMAFRPFLAILGFGDGEDPHGAVAPVELGGDGGLVPMNDMLVQSN